jgi:hypothetical protein
MSVITKQTDNSHVNESIAFHSVDINLIDWDTPDVDAIIGELRFGWDTITNFVYVAGADQNYADDEETRMCVSLQNSYQRDMKHVDSSDVKKDVTFSRWLTCERSNRSSKNILAVFDKLVADCENSNSALVPKNIKDSHDARIISMANMTTDEKIGMLIQKVGKQGRYQRTYCHFRIAQLYIGSISANARALMGASYDRMHKGDLTVISESMNNNTRATGLVHSVIAANNANGDAAIVVKSQWSSFRNAGSDHNAILANLQNMSMIDIAKTVAELNEMADKRHHTLMVEMKSQTIEMKTMNTEMKTVNIALNESKERADNALKELAVIIRKQDETSQDLFEALAKIDDAEKIATKTNAVMASMQLKLVDADDVAHKTNIMIAELHIKLAGSESKLAELAKDSLDGKNLRFKLIEAEKALAEKTLEAARAYEDLKRANIDRVMYPYDGECDGRFVLLYNKVIDMYAVIRTAEGNIKRMLTRYSSNYDVLLTLRSPNPHVLYKKIKEVAHGTIQFSGVDFSTTRSQNDVVDFVRSISIAR